MLFLSYSFIVLKSEGHFLGGRESVKVKKHNLGLRFIHDSSYAQQEYGKSDVVSFSVPLLRRHMTLLCPNIGNVSSDQLVRRCLFDFSTLKLPFSPL